MINQKNHRNKSGKIVNRKGYRLNPINRMARYIKTIIFYLV